MDPVNINHLNLPTGTYLLTATVEFNNAGDLGEVVCSFTEGSTLDGYQLNIPGGGFSQTTTMHSVLNIASGVTSSVTRPAHFTTSSSLRAGSPR